MLSRPVGHRDFRPPQAREPDQATAGTRRFRHVRLERHEAFARFFSITNCFNAAAFVAAHVANSALVPHNLRMARRSLFPPLSPSKDPAQYPVFSGQISRWAWRLYAQRLTAAGRWFVVMTIVFVPLAGPALQPQVHILGAYAAVFWLVALAAAVIYRPTVALALRCPSRVCAGQELLIDADVEQRGRFTGADLIVVPHNLPAGLDAKPDGGARLGDLRTGQTATVRLGIVCAQRGAFTLPGFRVETYFPFGLIRARRTFATGRSLLVYPQFSPLVRLALPTGRRFQPGGVALASNVGESFEYLGNREFRDGDNIRDIDWRATARIQRPIVREWVEEYMLRVAVILDTHISRAIHRRQRQVRRDDFERAVSLSAAVSDHMARHDYLVDLFAAGPDLYHLTAGRSLAYLDQILEILACVESSAEETFAVIGPKIAELLSQLSSVICVLLDWDENRRAFVHQLHRQGVGVKVIVCRDAPCTIDPALDARMLGPIAVVNRVDFDRGIVEL